MGYLAAAEDYHFGNAGYYDFCKCTAAGSKSCSKDMWHDHEPAVDIVDEMYYSTNYFTATAIQKIRARNQSAPFYLHLTYQSVHAPFEDPPSWLSGYTDGSGM